MLREGTFTNPTEGLTVYVRERSSDGTVHGILVQDSRNKLKPTTYLAETGSLVKSPAGPRLVMFNGNIQRVDRTADGESGPVTLLYFDKYTYDLSSYIQQEPEYYNEARERYFSELVNPAPDDAYAKQFRTQLFALVALAALLPAPFSRRGYGMRIAMAASIALFFRVLAFGIVSSAATAPAAIPLMYIIPLLVCAMAGAVLSGVPLEAKAFAGLNAIRAMIRHPRSGRRA
jgi:lipopolysaccharide export system permease protein